MPQLRRNNVLTDVTALTFENYLPTLYDNISKGTPFLNHLNNMGSVEMKDGGKRCDVEIQYKRSGQVGTFNKNGLVPTESIDLTTRASYEWGLMVGGLAIYDVDRADNAGQSQIIDMVSTRIMSLEDEINERFSTELLNSDTAKETGTDDTMNRAMDAGGTFCSLGHLIAAPNTVAVGGIRPNDSSNFNQTFWNARTRTDRPTNYNYNTSLRKDLSDFCRTVANNQQKPPDLILTNQETYGEIEDIAWDKAQLESRGGTAEVDFQFPQFMFGPSVVRYDNTMDEVGQANNHKNRIYLINSDCIKFLKMSHLWGDKIGPVRDQTTMLDYWQVKFRGQLVTTNRRFTGWWDQAA